MLCFFFPGNIDLFYQKQSTVIDWMVYFNNRRCKVHLQLFWEPVLKMKKHYGPDFYLSHYCKAGVIPLILMELFWICSSSNDQNLALWADSWEVQITWSYCWCQWEIYALGSCWDLAIHWHVQYYIWWPTFSNLNAYMEAPISNLKCLLSQWAP